MWNQGTLKRPLYSERYSPGLVILQVLCHFWNLLLHFLLPLELHLLNKILGNELAFYLVIRCPAYTDMEIVLNLRSE